MIGIETAQIANVVNKLIGHSIDKVQVNEYIDKHLIDMLGMFFHNELPP